MAKVKLTRAYFDGAQLHKVGAILDIEKPPKSARPLGGKVKAQPEVEEDEIAGPSTLSEAEERQIDLNARTLSEMAKGKK